MRNPEVTSSLVALSYLDEALYARFFKVHVTGAQAVLCSRSNDLHSTIDGSPCRVLIQLQCLVLSPHHLRVPSTWILQQSSAFVDLSTATATLLIHCFLPVSARGC